MWFGVPSVEPDNLRRVFLANLAAAERRQLHALRSVWDELLGRPARPRCAGRHPCWDLQHHLPRPVAQLRGNPGRGWGHHGVAFTLTRYGGLFKDGSEAAVDRLDLLLGGSSKVSGNVLHLDTRKLR
jgi:hypothetical protein